MIELHYIKYTKLLIDCSLLLTKEFLSQVFKVYAIMLIFWPRNRPLWVPGSIMDWITLIETLFNQLYFQRQALIIESLKGRHVNFDQRLKVSRTEGLDMGLLHQ